MPSHRHCSLPISDWKFRNTNPIPVVSNPEHPTCNCSFVEEISRSRNRIHTPDKSHDTALLSIAQVKLRLERKKNEKKTRNGETNTRPASASLRLKPVERRTVQDSTAPRRRSEICGE